jgi:hypothetical protein
MYCMCKRGERGSGCVESIFRSYTLCTKLLYHPKLKPRRGGGHRQKNTKYLYWSIFKKRRHLGFGIFIDIWSMMLHSNLLHKTKTILRKSHLYFDDGVCATEQTHALEPLLTAGECDGHHLYMVLRLLLHAHTLRSG